MKELEKLYKPDFLFSSIDRECKLKVIEDFDTPIIKDFLSKNYSDKKSLIYLGLAGASLTDFHHWGEYIKKGISVEKATNVYHQQIRSLFHDKLYRGFDNLSNDVAVIYYDLDALFDPKDKNTLSKNDNISRFLPFNFINLDYYGSVMNTEKDTGVMKRIELIKNLMKIQQEHLDINEQYLLFLTIYHMGKEHIPQDEESQLKKKIPFYATKQKHKDIVKEVLAAKPPRIPLLSLGIPCFLAENALTNHTKLTVLEKITYRDTQTTMIHFVFLLEDKYGQHPEPSKKSIYETPLKKVEKKSNKIIISNYFSGKPLK